MTRRLSATSVVLAAAAVLSAGPAGGGPAAKPQLSVVTLRPFVVAGSGFRADETVRVAVHADAGAASTRDRATGTGRIGVRFARLRLGRCPRYVVAASGDKGSYALLRSVPRACGIDPRPAP
jgi:hypothetical protein